MSFHDDWHVPVDRLVRYAGGDANPIERDSIEAHLLACDHCRSNLTTARPSAGGSHDATLLAITNRIDHPRRPLRGATGSLRVSIASPSFVLASTLLVSSLVIIVAISNAFMPRWSALVLILIAPLAPVAAAAIAFLPTTDPAGSLAVATPLAAGRLPFIRAMFGTAVSALAGFLSSAFTPLGWYDSVAWLAPGFAFAAIVVAGSTWVHPVHMAVGLGTGWAAICAVWARGQRNLVTVDAVNALVTRGARVQVACLVVIVLATLVTLSRRDSQPNWRTA